MCHEPCGGAVTGVKIALHNMTHRESNNAGTSSTGDSYPGFSGVAMSKKSFLLYTQGYNLMAMII